MKAKMREVVFEKCIQAWTKITFFYYDDPRIVGDTCSMSDVEYSCHNESVSRFFQVRGKMLQRSIGFSLCPRGSCLLPSHLNLMKQKQTFFNPENVRLYLLSIVNASHVHKQNYTNLEPHIVGHSFTWNRKVICWIKNP